MGEQRVGERLLSSVGPKLLWDHGAVRRVNAVTALFRCIFFMIWHPLNLSVCSSCCVLSCVFSASGKWTVFPLQTSRWLPHLIVLAYTVVFAWKLSLFSHLWPNLTHSWKLMSKATSIEAFCNVHSPDTTLDFLELLQCFPRLYGASNCLPRALVLHHSSPPESLGLGALLSEGCAHPLPSLPASLAC